jgi:hypothetical protein
VHVAASEEDLDDASSSQVLLDIYGPKIKMEVRWLFESPVVMRDLNPIGVLAQAAGPKFKQPKVNPFGIINYYDEEYFNEDEENNIADRKYEMI